MTTMLYHSPFRDPAKNTAFRVARAKVHYDPDQTQIIALFLHMQPDGLPNYQADYAVSRARRYARHDIHHGINYVEGNPHYALLDAPQPNGDTLDLPADVDTNQDHHDLYRALESIPIRRATVALLWAHDYTFDEIGQYLGITKQAAHHHFRNAIHDLRNLLK